MSLGFEAPDPSPEGTPPPTTPPAEPFPPAPPFPLFEAPTPPLPSAAETGPTRAAPPPGSPSLAPPPPEPPGHPIVFHGKADEYFRIWVVNTLLTLLTLGVFFAWAKVRKRRYLRGSTELLGHRFDYRANPIRLLFGHIIVMLLFLGYSLFGVVYPTIRFGVLGLGVALLPWIVVRSMTFNAHNTVYRGLRFRFNRSLSAAARVYLFEPVFVGLTFGLYYPAWQRSKREYAISNHRFGDAYFRFDARVGRFYSTYLLAGAIVLAALFVGSFWLGLIATRHGVRPGLVQMLPFFVVYGLGFFVSRQLVYAGLFNHIWNHTRLDEHRFVADLRTGKWLGLQLANLGGIVASLGMLYPWAVIRAQRYAASCLRFVPAGPLDCIQRIGGSSGSATGDMAAEFIGLDFGL